MDLQFAARCSQCHSSVEVDLGLAFTPRFPDLTGSQQAIYLVTLVLSAVSAALLIGPVGYHRIVFRQRLRAQLVKTGHRYAVAGLVLLLLALVGAVQLAASFVVGGWASVLAAALPRPAG